MTAPMIVFNTILCVLAFAAVLGLGRWGMYRGA
jgi:hypothetical protein